MSDKKTYLQLMVNHSAMYVATMLAVYAIHYFVTAITGQFNYLDGIVFSHGYEANPHFGSWFQNRGAIKYTYAAGPIACAVLAILVKVAHATYWCKQRNDVRMYLQWTWLHAVNLFIGGALVGMVTQRGFGHAILYASKADQMARAIITFLSMIALIIIGARSIRFHLEHAPNEDIVLMDNRDSRISYLFSVAAVPWFIGTVVMTIFQLPGFNTVVILQQLTMLFIIIPSVSFHKLSFRFFLQPEPVEYRAKWEHMIAAVVLFLVLRAVLWGGLEFPAFVQ